MTDHSITPSVTAWIDSGNAILCNNYEERHDLLKYLESLGYKIGFREEDYPDSMYIGFGKINTNEIHCCRRVPWDDDRKYLSLFKFEDAWKDQLLAVQFSGEEDSPMEPLDLGSLYQL